MYIVGFLDNVLCSINWYTWEDLCIALQENVPINYLFHMYILQTFKNIDCFVSKLTDKWQCYGHFQPFFANYMTIFHRTETQTVILRCLKVLNLCLFKSYHTESKFFHFCFFVIL